MGQTDLVYYPQMEEVVRQYARSPEYRGERLLRIHEFERLSRGGDEVVIFGRSGHYHHYDLRHIRLLRDRGKLPAGNETTLVLYDWHEDLDHDPRGTELGNGTWGYLGLMEGLYANMYVVGTDPRGFNELNSTLWDGEEIRATTEETLKLLDRVCLFPAEVSHYCLKLFPECEHFLDENCSVDKYFTVREGGFVQVRFKSATEVSYERRKEGVVVSIDLDVLKKPEVKTDCPQGAMGVDELLGHLEKLRQTGRINTFLICGLAESAESVDEKSLESVSRVLSRCAELLGD